MKYLIFGTGSKARGFLRRLYSGYFEHGANSILAFVDNNTAKIGNKFLDKPIISPCDIQDYDYDYILIASSFEKEIRAQLTDELNCKPECILLVKDMQEIVRDYFEKELKICEKKIVEISPFEEMKSYMATDNQWQLYFKKPPVVIQRGELHNLDMSEYDYVIVDDIYGWEDFYMEDEPIISEKRLVMHISEELGVSLDKILTEVVKDPMYHVDLEVCWGDENPDKTFYVIRLPACWSLLRYLKLVVALSAYARSKGYIPIVDGLTFPSLYLEESEFGKVNVWERFFEQPDVWKMEDIKQSKHIILSGTSMDPKLSRDFGKIVAKPKLKVAADEFSMQLKKYKKVLGVRYRGTDLNNRRWRFHPIQPTVEQMISIVEEKINEWNQEDGEAFDAIFFCTEDEEAVRAFHKRFGDKLVTLQQERWPSDCGGPWIYAANHFSSKEDWAVNYWVDTIMLSKCHSLVSCLCAGQSVAEAFNEICYENVSPYVHIHHVSYGFTCCNTL